MAIARYWQLEHAPAVVPRFSVMHRADNVVPLAGVSDTILARIRRPRRIADYRGSIYDPQVAIVSFRCAETRALFERYPVRRFGTIERIARRKLEQLHAAAALEFPRVPPGNRLEILKGDRKGQCSIRINDQWRLCFRWTGHDAEGVEIVDYH